MVGVLLTQESMPYLGNFQELQAMGLEQGKSGGVWVGWVKQAGVEQEENQESMPYLGNF